jgi:hypothetical protein
MYTWIRNLLMYAACGLAALTLGPMLGVDAADAPSSPVYVVKGDLAEVKSKGAIRLAMAKLIILPAPEIRERRSVPWRKIWPGSLGLPPRLCPWPNKTI